MNWSKHNDYFDVPAVSNSFLGQIKRELEGIPPFKPSRALAFGSGFHEMVLEPDKFDFSKYTGKERYRMMRMWENYKMAVPEEMTGGEAEKELFWEAHGFKCKCKVDLINDNWLVDLKTTAATSPQDFLEMADKYGYYRQGAWYLDAPQVKERGIDNFAIVAVSKQKDPQVFVFRMDREHGFYLDGKDEYMWLLSKLKEMNQYNYLKSKNDAKQVSNVQN